MGIGLVYEVNLEVDRAVAADYRAWLAGHIAEILAEQVRPGHVWQPGQLSPSEVAAD